MVKVLLKQYLKDDYHNDKWKGVASEYTQLLRDGYWDDVLDGQYVNTIFQTKAWGLEPSDVMAFARVHTHIASGKVGVMQVYIGDTPKSNDEIDDNNSALGNLPEPFSARFNPERGAGAIADGKFFWDKPFVIGIELAQDNTQSQFVVKSKPNIYLPLEVGTTKGHVTLYHLLTSGGVARWCYGSEWLTVLMTVDELGQDADGNSIPPTLFDIELHEGKSA